MGSKAHTTPKVHFCTAVLGCLLLTFTFTNAQNHTDLEGRVYSANEDVAGTHVVNRTTLRATITDANGFFAIPVLQDDTLVFTAVHFKRKELVVTQEILDSEPIAILLEEIVTELDEVVVMPYNLTGNIDEDLKQIKIEPVVDASSLGLLKKEIRFKPNGVWKTVKLSKYADLVIGYDTVALQPEIYLMPKIITIYDDISGATKDRKKYAAIEGELALIDYIKASFSEEAFIEELEIPKVRIDEFLNYCTFDVSFDLIVASGDYLKLWEFFKKKSPLFLDNSGTERE